MVHQSDELLSCAIAGIVVSGAEFDCGLLNGGRTGQITRGNGTTVEWCTQIFFELRESNVDEIDSVGSETRTFDGVIDESLSYPGCLRSELDIRSCG